MNTFRSYLFIFLVGIIVVGIVAVFARYQQEIRAARERVNSLGSQVLQTDCRYHRVRSSRRWRPSTSGAWRIWWV